jgi:hypothetical protein
MDTPPLSMPLLRVSKAHGLLHNIRAGSLDDLGPFLLVVEHMFGQRCHTWGSVLKCPTSPRDYWLGKFISHGHPSSLNAFFESMAHGLLHSIRAGSLDDVGHFLPVVQHVFGQRCHTWEGVLKYLTSPRDYWPGKFISHGHPSSLKASFESE